MVPGCRHPLFFDAAGSRAGWRRKLLLELLAVVRFEFERGVNLPMKTHFETRSVRKTAGKALAGIFVLCLIALAVTAQAPPNVPPPAENIATGALVIPMDNVNQGNAGGTTFNLRAYGLANLFLQNNIPVKWAIKPGKAKDATDFSAAVTRINGSAGVSSGTVNFSGGPFIVPVEYDTPSLRSLITTFNAGGTDVVVYKTTAATTADVRYTLTHKPKIAVGPDGGGFGTGVHQTLFTAAGIPNFDSVTDDLIDTNACYTLATQAHSTSSNFVNLYKSFVVSGGNLLLQCASVNTFENNANGHFQTTNPGYSIFGTNDGNEVSSALVYPEGAMPFNQFIGVLADQDGAVTEYAYAAGGGPANGNRVSVRNSSTGNTNKYVATVSELSGAGAAGGVVFELGGHDYTRTQSGASLIERLNGQRMILNAVFVPVTRPTSCGLQQATVLGYKSVRRSNDRQGGIPLIPGDTLEWTIDYINNSPVDVTNFNIRDQISVIDGVLTGNLTLVAGSNLVTLTSGGATASRNTNYDGIGDDSTSDLLANGAFLPVGGRIQVKVRTVINVLGSNGQPLPNNTILYNQTLASGPQITGTVKSDAVDQTNTSIFGIDTPPADSFLQLQNVGILDPTIARIKAPTAADASVQGEVRTADGAPIMNALVTVTNAGTGESRSARSNASGAFSVNDLPVGNLYIVTVQHKRYSFDSDPVILTLTDNVSGLAFIGTPRETKGGRAKIVVSNARGAR